MRGEGRTSGSSALDEACLHYDGYNPAKGMNPGKVMFVKQFIVQGTRVLVGSGHNREAATRAAEASFGEGYPAQPASRSLAPSCRHSACGGDRGPATDQTWRISSRRTESPAEASVANAVNRLGLDFRSVDSRI